MSFHALTFRINYPKAWKGIVWPVVFFDVFCFLLAVSPQLSANHILTWEFASHRLSKVEEKGLKVSKTSYAKPLFSSGLVLRGHVTSYASMKRCSCRNDDCNSLVFPNLFPFSLFLWFDWCRFEDQKGKDWTLMMIASIIRDHKSCDRDQEDKQLTRSI